MSLNIGRQNIIPATFQTLIAAAGTALIGSVVTTLGKLDQLATLKGLAANKFTLLKLTVGVALISGSISSATRKLQIKAAPGKKGPETVKKEKRSPANFLTDKTDRKQPSPLASFLYPFGSGPSLSDAKKEPQAPTKELSTEETKLPKKETEESARDLCFKAPNKELSTKETELSTKETEKQDYPEKQGPANFSTVRTGRKPPRPLLDSFFLRSRTMGLSDVKKK